MQSLDGSALTSPDRNYRAPKSEWRPGPNGLFLSLRESPSPLARTVDIPVVVARSPAGRSSSRMTNRIGCRAPLAHAALDTRVAWVRDVCKRIDDASREVGGVYRRSPAIIAGLLAGCLGQGLSSFGAAA